MTSNGATTPTLLSETIAGDLTFTEVIIGIVIALILVTLWQRVIENWLFETLGINRKSTFQTLVVAVGFTVVFFFFLSIISSFARDIILGTTNNTGQTNTEQLFGSSPTTDVDVEPRCCDERTIDFVRL